VDGTLRDGDLKARVLDATNIVELVGRTVALQRRGKSFVGLCPFHQEKTPSFNVNPAKQTFYCFGCKKCGNAIDFVIERDRLEFKDALRQLAQLAGIPVTDIHRDGQKPGEMQVLRDAQSAACMFFEKQLASPAGQAARDYLASRGFTAESIQRFRIGVALDSWDGLLNALSRKFAPPQLALAGLVKPRENGSGFYDAFRNRVMFPIRDAEGRIIAFGGRVMPGSDDKAKYLNSPETALFDKGRCAFGIDLAREKILASRLAAVVEGYTDVVMAHQFGCANVVSTLGTALTPRHVALLGRFADKVVLLFDPDTAGDLAVDRAVELFLTQAKVEIAVASLPDGLDPDEFLIQRGAAAFDEVLAGATDALTYKWRQLVRKFNRSNGDLTGQQKAVEEYLALMASARQSGFVDPLRWGAALHRVSRLTEIPATELQRRFKNRPGAKARPPQAGGPDRPNTVVPPPPALPSGRDQAERWILGCLLQEPAAWHRVQMDLSPEDFAEGPRRELAELYWRHQRDEGEPVLSHFLGQLENPAVKATAAQLAEEAERLDEPELWLNSGLQYFLSERRRALPEKEVLQLRGSTSESDAGSLQRIFESSKIDDGRRLPFRYVG
jgi:DNA primase